ncbi:uncharacterized protein LOC128743597 [Sabethes cyaneus]|uniref:uncharacterized protein LOC128743597 n=1 Tax=Sabethes cyaneus TaxID=53552 RepID=UPI00237E2815|nr:uncharacterized protein LOC128743597 [Sabethes cyaneus]
MDKSTAKAKRRQDKCHKKRPPVKASEAPQKSTKSTVSTSEPLVIYDDRYSKRPIESNWSVHREISSESESEDDQARAADFEELLRLPHSISGHFFLSTEKHWLKEASESPISTGNRFKIDTKHLNASLATIPFHERNEYHTEIFVDSEIISMKLKAELETKKYQNLCAKLESSKKMSYSGKTPPVKSPAKSNALPLNLSSKNDAPVSTPSPPPQQPVPCLIGPMALPPELRSNPHVTGSYTSIPLEATADVGQDEMKKDNEINSPKATKAEQTKSAVENNSSTAKEETKEAIQQWLDDILDM